MFVEHSEFRDTYKGAHFTVSIEKCQGDWWTFSRYLGLGDPHAVRHSSREVARGYAVDFLKKTG